MGQLGKVVMPMPMRLIGSTFDWAMIDFIYDILIAFSHAFNTFFTL